MSALEPSVFATLQARVAAHPWRTLGGAFLVGAWLGFDPPRAPRNGFVRAAFAIVGSLTIRVAREIALGELLARTAQPISRPMPPMWPARPMHH
jgi:hypothetical protein